VIRQERELYAPIRDFLAAQGFEVRGEVAQCDIVATRGEELVAIELKRAFGIDVLLQAVRRQRFADSVYVALPKPRVSGREKRWRLCKSLLRQLELGLILVHDEAKPPFVEIVFHPLPYRRPRNAGQRRAALRETRGRSGDYNVGGAPAGARVTAYRENAIHLACALEAFGPLSPRQLRALETGPKTLAILSANVYGWFERVERGVYAITETGRQGLAKHAWLADVYRARLPESAQSAPKQAHGQRARRGGKKSD